MAGRSLLRHWAALLTAVLGAGWPLAVLLLGALPAWSVPAPVSALMNLVLMNSVLMNRLLWGVAAIAIAGAVIGAAIAALLAIRRRHQRHTQTTTAQQPTGFLGTR